MGKRRKKKQSARKICPQYVGKVQMTREGFVYVIVENQEQDIYVKASATRGALHGDTVRVAVTREMGAGERGKGERGARREGTVVEVLERTKKPFVGVFHTVGAQAWVLMQSRTMPYDIEVDAEQAAGLGAERGFKVAAVVDRWNRGDQAPVGHLVDVLGAPGANETEMHAILSEFGLPYRFEKDVEKAAGKACRPIGRKDLEGRRDFRDVLTFTIDPSDAKDFDDALSFRALPGGNFEVGVHIADVSHYVTPGSPVDREARERGTSVYLVDRTVPMLPEALCNEACSLKPGEDKLCFSAVFELSPEAKVVHSTLGRTVIRSDYRLDYDAAQAVITAPDGSCPEGMDPKLTEALRTVNALAQTLRQRRFKAGVIDFDRPETKVECDSDGKPVRIWRQYSCEANWLIEEFMLLANMTVATFVSGKHRPFVYRIHDVPDPGKLDSLRKFAKGFGYKMGEDLQGRKAARSIGKLLSGSKDKPEGAAFQEIALRAMAKARYSTQNIGHFGLAMANYTHFTSPIRRYPDLLVHRLLAACLKGEPGAGADWLEEECVHASERESLAAEAERTSIKYKFVEYMQDHVGDEFAGHISGLTEWGMYVEVEPTHIEGMVPLREVQGDFYVFEEDRYRIVGRRTHKVFRLGDEVRIRVKSANLEQRLLDFELID